MPKVNVDEAFAAVPAPRPFLHAMALPVRVGLGFALAVDRFLCSRRAKSEPGTSAAWRNAHAVLRA